MQSCLPSPIVIILEKDRPIEQVSMFQYKTLYQEPPIWHNYIKLNLAAQKEKLYNTKSSVSRAILLLSLNKFGWLLQKTRYVLFLAKKNV